MKGESLSTVAAFVYILLFLGSSEDAEPAAAKAEKPEEPVEAAWSDEDTDVFHLTENTFDEFIKTHSSALVMFYAPCKCEVCCHCMKVIVFQNGKRPVSDILSSVEL